MQAPGGRCGDFGRLCDCLVLWQWGHLRFDCFSGRAENEYPKYKADESGEEYSNGDLNGEFHGFVPDMSVLVGGILEQNKLTWFVVEVS